MGTSTTTKRKHVHNAVVACAAVIVGCAQTHFAPAPAPVEPQERLSGRFIYPTEPVRLNYDTFQASLDQLAEQVTLVYVVGPHADYRQHDFACLDQTYRTFYRHALHVLLIDLHPADHWTEFTRPLRAINATVAAATFDPNDLPKLKRFLVRDQWRDRQLFLIDPASADTVQGVTVDSCPALRRRIREYLQERRPHRHVHD